MWNVNRGRQPVLSARWIRSGLLALAGGALALSVGVASAQDLSNVAPPTIPPPAPVTVDHATTALVTLDVTQAICTPQPVCMNTVPTMAGLITKARAAGAFILLNSSGGSPQVDGLGQQPSDTETAISNADKFYNSELNDVLSSNNVQTVILQGWAGNRAVLFTAEEAVIRGYNVVVAVDGAVGITPYDTLLTQYQLLNEVGTPNVSNTPLAPKGITLSRSDLITFQ